MLIISYDSTDFRVNTVKMGVNVESAGIILRTQPQGQTKTAAITGKESLSSPTPLVGRCLS